jgi:hypothetical protein
VNSQYTDLRFIHVNCTALQYSPQQQFLGQLVCVRGLLEERHYRRSGNVFVKKISGEFFYQATGQSQRHSQVSDPSMKSFAMAIPSNFFHLREYKFRTAKWTIALPPTIPNNGLPTSRLHERDIQKCVLAAFAARMQHRRLIWMPRAFSLPGNAYDLAPASRKLAPC